MSTGEQGDESDVSVDGPERSPAGAGPYCVVLGETLRDLRVLHGLHLSGAAAAAGISTSTLSRIELGHRKPAFAVLARLSELYETSLFALLMLVSRSVSPEAVLPRGEHAALLWVLLRYDEARPLDPA